MGVSGRPSKLTKKVQEAICEAISIGATKEMAAQYARVSVSAVMHWLEYGREERERIEKGAPPDPAKRKFVYFLHAVDDAQSTAGIGWLQVVDKAATTDPDWAWRMLRQRFPEGFREVTETQVSGVDGRPIEHLVKVEYVNNWRGEGNPTPASSGAADRALPPSPLQVAGGGEALAKDDDGATSGH